MNNSYLAKVDAFIRPFLEKNGYFLIKSEFVKEDSLWYLRLYIDLTEDEIRKRSAGNDLLTADIPCGIDNIGPEDVSGQHSNLSEGSTVDGNGETAGNTGDLGSACTDADAAEEMIIPGIDISDCAKVSRYLSKWLDKEDFISETYTLEVCSKGFLQ